MIAHHIRRFRLLFVAVFLCSAGLLRCEAQAVYKVQLVEKNRQTPLANEPVVVIVEVDATRVQSENFRSDEQGVIDLTEFRQKQQKLFDQYGKRASWELWYQEARTDLTNLRQNEAGFAKVELDLGPVMVTGRFVNEKGQPISNGVEVFPAELRPYLTSSNLGWSQQCRLYGVENGEPEKMVSNGIRFEANGSFRFYVAKNSIYRFDWLGMHDMLLVNRTFAVHDKDVELKLIVEPKRYCLYGDFVEAVGGQPVKDWININGRDVHFYGQGQSKYAVFFDIPGKEELTVGAYVFQKKYREQTVTVDVREPLQRHDFHLELLEGNAATVKYHVKINGPALEKPYDVYCSLSGEKYFIQSGEYKGNNIYEFTLPQAGRYKLNLASQKYSFEPPASVTVENEQTLEVKAVAKDTWLTVRVLDEKGAPVSFPAQSFRSMHEPRVNCVLLEEAGTTPKTGGRSRGSYISSGLGEVGSALRPDENGEMRFLLSRGGQFVLGTDFTQFVELRQPIEIATHESKTVELRLKARQ